MDFSKYIHENKIFTIFVKTNSSKTKLTDFNILKNGFRMEVKAQPENNKANIEIIKFFKKNYKINVSIIRGLTSKKKLLKIIH